MHRGKGMKFVGRLTSPAPEHRKPNIPKDYSEYPGKTEAFWPNFLLKEWMVGAVFLSWLFMFNGCASISARKNSRPKDTGYIPLPDWYFLFLYQLLKYTYASGPYNIIGALVIPGLAFGALMLAPFIDRGPERKPSKRPLATGFMLLAIAGITYLTWEAVDNHDWEAAAEQGKIVAEADIDTTAEGYQIIETNGCISCHGNQLEGGAAAPALVGTGLTSEQIAEIAKNGTESGKMPPGLFKGTDEELTKLSEFISSIESK